MDALHYHTKSRTLQCCTSCWFALVHSHHSIDSSSTLTNIQVAEGSPLCDLCVRVNPTTCRGHRRLRRANLQLHTRKEKKSRFACSIRAQN